MHKILVSHIKAFTNEFHIVHREHDTAIYFHTAEGKNSDTHDMFSYSNKNTRSWAFVVRGLPDDMDEQELANELTALKLELVKLYKMKKTKTPLFLNHSGAAEQNVSVFGPCQDQVGLVQVGKDQHPVPRQRPASSAENANAGATQLLIASPRTQTKTSIQCRKCQRWGHSASNCFAKDPKCVKCAECQRWGHSASNCFAKDPKCVKCAESHATHNCRKEDSRPSVLTAVETTQPVFGAAPSRTPPITAERKTAGQGTKAPRTKQPQPLGSSNPETHPEGTQPGPTSLGATRATRGPTNILHWNMDGYNNKAEELDVLLQEHDVHIAFLNETKLRPDQHLRHRGFRVIRSDGSNGQGGVAALVERNLACAVLAKTQQPRSPRQRLTEAVIADLFGRTSRHLVIGDLNARHVNWNNANNNANGRVLNNLAERTNFVVQHPDEPTCYPHNGQTPSTIDIVLNKGTALLGTAVCYTDGPATTAQYSSKSGLADPCMKMNLALISRLQTGPNLERGRTSPRSVLRHVGHNATRQQAGRTRAGATGQPQEENRTEKTSQTAAPKVRKPRRKESINRLTAEIKETVASIKSHNWAETLRRAETANGSAWKLTSILTKSRPKIHHLETDRGPSCRPEEIAETLAGHSTLLPGTSLGKQRHNSR
ncbi:Endonuclease-reverse transcriptase [Popillia japonica]|uniref:Endonuclease-reverse transcriptase n=1 Tax=Popillia japonica TaxID=7064 RepID=A0AAW1JQV1_POPJA